MSAAPKASGIAAKSLLPPAFSNVPNWAWEPKQIAEGSNEIIYLTSPFEAGWRYYTKNKTIHLSKEYPEGWENDVGYAYGHGPGKVDEKTGEPKEERGKPSGCWLFRGWLVKEGRMAACTIGSYGLQLSIEQALENPEFKLMQPSSIANFYFTFFHNKNPASKNLKFTVTAAARPMQSADAKAAAKLPWYPEAYWLGLNPFEEPTNPPANAGQPGLPATTFDENGSESEVPFSEGEPEAELNW
jgi:hypothetical protein